VQLFTVCVHHFLGSNYEYIYRTLEEEFPDIDFYRCYMDPVMQKKGLTPDQKLRRAMFSKLPECDTKGNVVAILGGDFCFDRGSDLVRFLEWSGCDLRQVQSAKTYDEYLKLSEACLFIDVHPAGETGVSNSAKRLGRNYLYLPATFDYDEIDAELKKLADALDIDASDFLRDNGKYKSLIEDKLLTLKNKLSDTEIAIDATAHPRPLGLAKFLIEHGFTVKKVYLDVINPEEKEAFDKLKTIAPDLVLSATVHVKKRHLLEPEKNVLAIGQKAAYFEQTGHFVNLVNGGNLWGYSGIKTMLDIMDDAYENEKDTRDIVPRKGFGCVSCVEKYI
ncbi:MAG: nitrogenase, partial [Lachnospiraceae bacterium]|nr:nitrogenase [Lachnospiraceae bacterium]